ncbi:hypothetical protein GN956_G25460 [Arapaima gigas]
MAPNTIQRVLPVLQQKAKTTLMASALVAMCVLLNFILQAKHRCICRRFEDSEQILYLSLYLCLPAVSLFLMVIAGDKACVRLCQVCWCCSPKEKQDKKSRLKEEKQGGCSRYCCFYCRKGCRTILKAGFALCVWVISVLFDGNWYVCLQTSRNSSQVHLPCKSQDNWTIAEKSTLSHYSNQSLTCSLGLIFGLVLLWTLGAFISQGCCRPYYRYKHDRYREEETQRALKSHLKSLAKQEAETICHQEMPAVRRGSDEGPVVVEVNRSQQKVLEYEKISKPHFHLSALREAAEREEPNWEQ